MLNVMNCVKLYPMEGIKKKFSYCVRHNNLKSLSSKMLGDFNNFYALFIWCWQKYKYNNLLFFFVMKLQRFLVNTNYC